VTALHCDAAWDASLDALTHAMPREHDAGLAGAPQPLPASLAHYVAGRYAGARHTPLELAQETAARQGVHARVDVAVLDAQRLLRG